MYEKFMVCLSNIIYAALQVFVIVIM